jgi:peptidoglycan hydrolase-like protein with peptidoglycan-binding domain
MLNAISAIHPEIRPVEIDGIYGPDTTAAVIIFQNLYGLPVTGIVNEETWNKLNEVYQLSLLERETNT